MSQRKPKGKGPPLNIIIHIPIFLCGIWLILFNVMELYASYHHIAFKDIPNGKDIVISISLFIWWTIASFVLSNFIMHSVPYFSKIQQSYGNGDKEYAEAMRGLLIALAGASVICLPLALLTFFLPV